MQVMTHGKAELQNKIQWSLDIKLYYNFFKK